MNSFGRMLRITIFGESHGPCIGVVIDGCPAGLKIKPEMFFGDISRRKPGAKGTTGRVEDDIPEFKSGLYRSRTTGAPLTITFPNEDVRSSDYDKFKNTPRPGHADLVAKQKYNGYNDLRGGGMFSGRLTLPLVAAGVIAKRLIEPAEVRAEVSYIAGQEVYENVIEEAMKEGDSVGGIIQCTVAGLSPGLGEPFFDSVESMLSHAMFSIPGIKGVEFGVGFKCAHMHGSEYNDEILDSTGRTGTNNCGGINGGLTNGNPLVFQVAVRPTASISKKQKTTNLKSGKQVPLKVEGRHDACIALRVPVVVEAMTALVLADLMIQEQAIPRVMD